MLFAYIDESYDQEHYYLGAVLLTGEQLARFDVAVDDWCRAELCPLYGVHEDVEFHAHRLMQGAVPWSAMKGNVGAAQKLYRQFLRHLVASGARIYVEGVNVRRLNARYSYPDPPYEVTLRHLLEKLDNYARSQGEQVAVVADEVGRSNDYARTIERYAQTGTPGYRSSRLTSIVQPIRFGDSEDDRGIQAADMVAYIARRHLSPPGQQNKRAQKATRSLYHEVLRATPSVRTWNP